VAPLAAAPPATSPLAAAPPAAAPPACGNGSVELGEQCDDGNTSDGDGCLSTCRIEPIRTFGETQVAPSEETQDLMKRNKHNGVSIVKGMVRLCIATTGRVTEAKMLLPTGYPTYDQELLAAVRAWRYQPYTLNSTSKVCTSVSFNYPI